MSLVQIFNVCAHCRDGGPMTLAMPTQCVITAHPTNPQRFATGGGDNNIFIWQFTDKYECGMEQLARLAYHTKPINAISWDTTGEYIASAGDDEIISIWKQDTTYNTNNNNSSNNNNNNKSVFGDQMIFREKWKPYKKLRGALAEISNLCWIKNNKYLIVASLDGCIGLYDIYKQKLISSVKVGCQFIQGISVDYLNNLLVLQSTSATAKIYRIQQRKIKNKSKNKDKKNKFKYKLIQFQSLTYYPPTTNDIQKQDILNKEYNELLNIYNLNKYNVLNKDEIGCIKPRKKRVPKNSLFKHNLVTTSKKPCWSPDGLILCMVGGQSKNKQSNAVHIFHRSNISKKVITFLLPESSHATVARFCPFKFELNNNDIDNDCIVSKFKMKYKMFLSIICGSELFIFDTTKNQAIFYWKDEDTPNFFDMEWTMDGKSILISDIEGFITRIHFDNDDILLK